MGVIIWLLLGALVGWLSGIIVNGKKRSGGIWDFVINVIIGIVGSMLGGYIASLLGLGSFSTLSIPGLLIALGGACLLLIIINFVKKKLK